MRLGRLDLVFVLRALIRRGRAEALKVEQRTADTGHARDDLELLDRPALALQHCLGARPNRLGYHAPLGPALQLGRDQAHLQPRRRLARGAAKHAVLCQVLKVEHCHREQPAPDASCIRHFDSRAHGDTGANVASLRHRGPS